MTAYDPTAQFDLKTFDVPYLQRGGEAPLLATVYQPQGAGPFPALLEVHGGAWSRMDRTSSAHSVTALARSGIVVVCIDFRLAPQHPYPAQLQDINYAARWLKAHAAEFNADPATLGGYGSSSGGHTIVLAAMRFAYPWYAADPLPEAPDADASLRYVICHSGIVDPYARYQYAKGLADPRLAQSSEGFFLTEDGMIEANPQRILGRGEPVTLPPLLVIQGDQDGNIPWQVPERFANTWRAKGGEVEWRLYRDSGHTFANGPGQDSDRAIEVMKRFIARQVNAAPVTS